MLVRTGPMLELAGGFTSLTAHRCELRVAVPRDLRWGAEDCYPQLALCEIVIDCVFGDRPVKFCAVKMVE